MASDVLKIIWWVIKGVSDTNKVQIRVDLEKQENSGWDWDFTLGF